LIANDVVVIGGAMREGATVPTHDNTKGLVRGFDVRTGSCCGASIRSRGPASRQRDLGEQFLG
jgi:hypothetical protein